MCPPCRSGVPAMSVWTPAPELSRSNLPYSNPPRPACAIVATRTEAELLALFDSVHDLEDMDFFTSNSFPALVRHLLKKVGRPGGREKGLGDEVCWDPARQGPCVASLKCAGHCVNGHR